MNRSSEAKLLQFCVEQRRNFNADAWLQFKDINQLELATVLQYLAGTTWYTHQNELKSLANQLNSLTFAELARQTRFEPSRFSGLLKAHLKHAGLTSSS
jgi:uncharacterized protein YrrD